MTGHIIDSVDLSMARAIAYRLANKHDDDTESAAMAGLEKAARTYDPEKGAWVTYAVTKIRWAVLDEIRKTKPIPVDPHAMADHTVVVGIVTTGQGVERLKEALDALDAHELLDGVDMRRTNHRTAVTQIRKWMS